MVGGSSSNPFGDDAVATSYGNPWDTSANHGNPPKIIRPPVSTVVELAEVSMSQQGKEHLNEVQLAIPCVASGEANTSSRAQGSCSTSSAMPVATGVPVSARPVFNCFATVQSVVRFAFVCGIVVSPIAVPYLVGFTVEAVLVAMALEMAIAVGIYCCLENYNIRALKGEVANFKRENERLNGNVTRLEGVEKDLGEGVTQLKEENKTLQNQLATFKSNNEKLAETESRLSQSVDYLCDIQTKLVGLVSSTNPRLVEAFTKKLGEVLKDDRLFNKLVTPINDLQLKLKATAFQLDNYAEQHHMLLSQNNELLAQRRQALQDLKNLTKEFKTIMTNHQRYENILEILRTENSDAEKMDQLYTFCVGQKPKYPAVPSPLKRRPTVQAHELFRTIVRDLGGADAALVNETPDQELMTKCFFGWKGHMAWQKEQRQRDAAIARDILSIERIHSRRNSSNDSDDGTRTPLREASSSEASLVQKTPRRRGSSPMTPTTHSSL